MAHRSEDVLAPRQYDRTEVATKSNTAAATDTPPTQLYTRQLLKAMFTREIEPCRLNRSRQKRDSRHLDILFQTDWETIVWVGKECRARPPPRTVHSPRAEAALLRDAGVSWLWLDKKKQNDFAVSLLPSGSSPLIGSPHARLMAPCPCTPLSSSRQGHLPGPRSSSSSYTVSSVVRTPTPGRPRATSPLEGASFKSLTAQRGR